MERYVVYISLLRIEKRVRNMERYEVYTFGCRGGLYALPKRMFDLFLKSF